MSLTPSARREGDQALARPLIDRIEKAVDPSSWDPVSRSIARTALLLAHVEIPLTVIGLLASSDTLFGFPESQNGLAATLLILFGVVNLTASLIAVGGEEKKRSLLIVCSLAAGLPYLVIFREWGGPVWELLFFTTTLLLRPRLNRWLLPFVLTAILIDLWLTRGALHATRTVVLLLIAVGVGLCVAWVTTSSSRMRAAEAMLLPAAIQAERIRIARDLHDTLGTSLTAAATKIAYADLLIDTDPETARRELTDLHRLIRTALKDMRTTALEARQPDLAQELREAVSLLKSVGLTVHVTGDARSVVSHAQAAAAFLIRESSTNIIRHTRAELVHITLAPGSVGIWDDGTPIEHDDAPGTGLIGLTERVESSGGALVFGRNDAGGFHIVASWKPPAS
ncbi:two-component system sensor histidine kinase DesK [Microbacterium natoriense]|uniref:histidine kinase n=1 Tax=Microbacterium natoriense TaxID=284570 RepID=A0AAW8ERR7_9MICO|nr:histidine kinase [Microbacterium natoriense]MDQ0646226.1 two-component system sensor histidine kinase DesK [Microbacterium natoriense]